MQQWGAVFAIQLLLATYAYAADAWRSIGPASEPNVHCIVVDPKSPSKIYAGAVGQIWRTDDAGKTWTSADTPTPICDVRALTIDPADSSTLYAGCLGTIKSTDAGKTWTPMYAGQEDHGALTVVWALATDNASALYAGTPAGTVFKSVDHGSQWQRIGDLPAGTRDIRALAVDPRTSSTLYVAATIGGLFKSVNGGTSWTAVHSLPSDAVTTVAIDPASPAVYAGTIGKGIFKSVDGGATWERVFDAGALTIAELAIDPGKPSTLYTAIGDAGGGVYQSTDAGTTWHSYGTALPQFVALRALAIGPSEVYVGSLDQYPGYLDGGVFAIRANACASTATLPDFAEFAVPTAKSAPLGITAGPDCAVWFTESDGNKIGRITSTGQITEFPVPTPASEPSRITKGPDGALWFTEFAGNKIARMTTSGAVTEFPVPTPGSFPLDITTGPDGNLWFTEQGAHKIARITPAGAITEFLIPPLGTFGALPYSITSGPDGNLWFAELFTGRVGRVSVTGSMTLFPVEPSCCASLGVITAGPDGNLWVAETFEGQIVRVTPSGSMTYFASKPVPNGIVAGADGALWFTDREGYGRITTAGAITKFPLATSDADPEILAAGPDGGVWFTETAANKIARKMPAQAAPPPGRHRGVRH